MRHPYQRQKKKFLLDMYAMVYYRRHRAASKLDLLLRPTNQPFKPPGYDHTPCRLSYRSVVELLSYETMVNTFPAAEDLCGALDNPDYGL